jgi:hypothetical protein
MPTTPAEESIMTKPLFCIAVLATLVLLTSTVDQAPPAGGQEAAKDKPQVFSLQVVLEDRPRRVNGVRLRIEAKPGADGPRDRIQVRWTLSYNGPRWPFIILAPTLTRETDAQTALLFLATGKSGTTYGHEVQSPPPSPFYPFPFPPSKRDWFAWVERDGGGGSGTLEVAVADLKKYFTGVLPQEFDPAKPPRLYVRMFHSPKDRGEHLRLDAWTGRLRSTAVHVSLEDW